MTDNDPLGLQAYTEQRWAILKRRAFKYLFPPFALGLILGTSLFLKWFWGWLYR